ncbi:uncharacterized protein N7496_010743 [Penicillium cataractarum]|uniref:Uncharacterized protein n=1 Tax=Penicillium cataractarum TaxID=2100454 RepID=A0A9W9UWZ7_9EURO|nr:uncharacterized protein N7496_010743 [Penicillium cataractarum]KAJ5358330.1 hypothetical protein N7496_010743 [Penicillium cataractarum]
MLNLFSSRENTKGASPRLYHYVERLFNTTRDIYYYRRGRIKPKTIKELMLFLYILRFDLEE